MASVLYSVGHTNATGEWHRAEGNGQRVTLAALYRRGYLIRRKWRIGRNSADDAHEYCRPIYLRRGILKP
jgi:hypothetical protein